MENITNSGRLRPMDLIFTSYLNNKFNINKMFSACVFVNCGNNSNWNRVFKRDLVFSWTTAVDTKTRCTAMLRKETNNNPILTSVKMGGLDNDEDRRRLMIW